MGWPNDEAVKRAAKALQEVRIPSLRQGRRLDFDADEYAAEVVRDVLTAAGLPELVGSTDTAKILGVESSNLSRVAGLPAPLYELRGGRLYDAEEIRALAARRKAAA